MSKLTCTEIKAAVGLVALKHNLQVDWSSEDSFTWITMWRDGVKFKAEEAAVISQEIANSTQHDFYLSKILADGFEGAFDADMRKLLPDEIPLVYSDRGKSKICDYGERFEYQ
jgi:hypothetical protein